MGFGTDLGLSGVSFEGGLESIRDSIEGFPGGCIWVGEKFGGGAGGVCEIEEFGGGEGHGGGSRSGPATIKN